MAQSDIIDFDLTDRALVKAARHGIILPQLYAVLDNRHVLTRNRKDRAASHVLIGRDDQGRCLAIPVAPTEDPLIWRPITAWYCKPSEAAKLR